MATITEEESLETGLLNTAKPFLFGIGFVAFLFFIWVVLPMFFTYFSEGDVRPPSQIHPTDTKARSMQNNNY